MLEITWLGHGTFQFRLASGEVLVMDPWLDGNPAYPKGHSFDRVDTILKVFGMVNAVPDFMEHPKIINGCTDLFTEVFGDAGRPARSAVGMGSLPGDISVEVEAIVLLKG